MATMTWDQIESNWKQLKSGLKANGAELPDDERASIGAIDSTESARVRTAQTEIVSYKRSLHHGTAYIRRRNSVKPGSSGWSPAK
jgi:hypothetical protein